jgi:hypothetical protein
MKNKLSLLAVAMVAIFPMAQSAHAQSNAELKQEIELLKKQLQVLMQKVDAASAAPAAQATVDPQDFNRIKIKAESTEDNFEASGLKGFKISGMIDPTYIYSRNQDRSGFIFLNNFDARDGETPYAFDNGNFGQAMLDIQKETEGGNKWRLTLAPHKSASSAYNLGSIVHEASVSIPLIDPATRLIAGQFPDWSGYEYLPANQQPLITHNMLFDFTIPSFYSGAGMEITRGQWISKFLVGNVNQVARASGDKDPSINYRVDYSKGEFSGFGFAGTHTFGANSLNLFEVDGYFTRGDWTFQGQIGAGRWAGMGNDQLNGPTDAQWWGLSALAGYKLTPRLQAVARADYINNSKNGGGVFGYANAGAGVDSRNGFGASQQDLTDYAAGNITELAGANRYALSLGLNYLVNPTTTWKLELRYDGANKDVFQDLRGDPSGANGAYTNSNILLGTAVVVSF